jgi:Putative Ig domain
MKLVITIHIQEDSPLKNSVSISITITPSAGGGNLTIDASGVPASGQVGSPFSGSLKVSGGTPPYTYSLASGALPDGVSLMSDGTLSGTPTAAGDFTFGVDVADSGA